MGVYSSKSDPHEMSRFPMISIAHQEVAELGGPPSVLSRQKRDHIELHRLLGKLEASSPDQAGPLLIRIHRLVVPHAFAEEAVLWPAIRRALPDGHELTLRVEMEHQEINELVARMEAVPRSSPEWRTLLDKVIPLLLQDVRDEEDVLLPRLQQVLSSRQLRMLGARWASVRAIAPTRCHPIVSRRPPGNILSALPLSVIDRARDRVDTHRYRRRGTHPTAELLSAGLRRAGHAVERLPGMNRGEDKATHVAHVSGAKWFAGIAAALIAGAMLARHRERQLRKNHPRGEQR
jgi:hypothetical protein